METHQFVFICGLHRSGTSLLHRMLSEHQDISGFSDTDAPEDEGQHLQTLFKPARYYGGPGQFCFHPRAALNEHSSLITDINRQKLYDEWRSHWDMSKPILIEKSPPNIIRSRFMQAMFPNSKFIFITRHPIPVSLATKKWTHNSIVKLLRHWRVAHTIMLEDIAHLRHALIVRYEDLVMSTEQTLAAIYRFLQCDNTATTHEAATSVNHEYFGQWEQDYQHSAIIRLCVNSYVSRQLLSISHIFGYRMHAPYIVPANLHNFHHKNMKISIDSY